MISAPVELLGAQRPRVLHVPPGAGEPDGALAGEALELCASVGIELDGWQSWVLGRSLSERPDGSWVCSEVGVDVPRQNGKGGIIEARQLVGLFLLGERLQLYTAHLFSTSKESFYRLRRIIESCPDLDRHVRQIRQSNEEVSIETDEGCRLRYVARKGGSGRGFSGDVLVLDEVMVLDHQTMAAINYALAARPNPQIWYTGSAPIAATSEVWYGVRARGLSGTEQRLLWAEWSAEPPAGPDDPSDEQQVIEAAQRRAEWRADPVTWAQANPALGIRISVDTIARELAQDPETFERERLGVPDMQPGVDDRDPVIDPELWGARVDADSVAVGAVVVGVDVAPGAVAASICVVGERDDGLAHVELVEARRGTGWVAERLGAVLESRTVAAVAVDGGGPAQAILPDIERVCSEVAVDVVALTGRDYVGACQAMVSAVAEDQVRHLGQAWLATSLGGAAKRPVGEGWVWDRRNAAADISPIVAVTVALRVLQSVDVSEVNLW